MRTGSTFCSRMLPDPRWPLYEAYVRKNVVIVIRVDVIIVMLVIIH